MRYCVRVFALSTCCTVVTYLRFYEINKNALENILLYMMSVSCHVTMYSTDEAVATWENLCIREKSYAKMYQSSR